MDPWSPHSLLSPTPPGDFCRGRIILNALWGAPRASQDGGLAPKPTCGEPRIFQSPFLGSVVPKKHGLFPGSLLRVLSRHFPPNRAIEVASCCVPGGNPQKSHVQSTPPKRRHAAWTPAVGVLMARIDAEKHTLSPASIRVQNGRQSTALEVRQYGHRTTRHRRHAKITRSPGPSPVLSAKQSHTHLRVASTTVISF